MCVCFSVCLISTIQKETEKWENSSHTLMIKPAGWEVSRNTNTYCYYEPFSSLVWWWEDNTLPFQAWKLPGASGEYREDLVEEILRNLNLCCAWEQCITLLSQACLWPIRNRSDSDMASQHFMGPFRENLLGKCERMLSKTSDYFLFRDAGGLKDPGRYPFGARNNVPT